MDVFYAVQIRVQPASVYVQSQTGPTLVSVSTFMQREAKHSQSQRSLMQLQLLKAKQTCIPLWALL